jgi:hypothetical protein
VDKRCKASTCTKKRCTHTPQAKVLKFLVAILVGLEQLWDISLSAHPLDKASAVAGAWGQPAWVDYSGVSRTWHALRDSEKGHHCAGWPFLLLRIARRTTGPC